MTANQLIRVLLRRWYVLVVFAVLVVLAVSLIPRTPGVYTSQVDMVFLPPSTLNRLQDQVEGSVQFAAIVDREFNGNRGNAPIPLQTATLYGEGIRRGYTVTLHNDGGQWTNNFDRPDLSIEVVDSSPERVNTEITRLTRRISALSSSLQDAQNVAPADRIGVIESPSTAQVTYIAASTTRAAAATLALGVILAMLVTVLFDRIAERWTRNASSTAQQRIHAERTTSTRA
jgi:hypothetical protein